jgi:hypothetical protein
MGPTTVLMRARALVMVSSALVLGAAPAYANFKAAVDKADAAAKNVNDAAKDAGAPASDAGKRDLAKLRKDARDAEKKWLAANNYSIPRAKLKVESSRHASRLARLQRIRTLAVAANDQAAVGRVDALLSKEKGRHEQWAKKNGQKAAPGASASGTAPTVVAPPAASGAKGGAK